MDEQSITGSEFLMLIVAGLSIPWIIAIAIQFKIFVRRHVSKKTWLVSSLILLLLSVVLGVVIWSAVPGVTIAWQKVVFSLPDNKVKYFLAFVPIAPMALSVLLLSVPITLWFTRRHA